MITFPDAISPVRRQRVEWGQNIAQLLKDRDWSRKHLIWLVYDAYGIEISEPSLASWLKGDVAPRPDVQAAIAGVSGIPHHMLFPPVRLQRRTSQSGVA